MEKDESVSSNNGLTGDSSISLVFFNRYINNALEKLNEVKGISSQEYADKIIICSSRIKNCKILSIKQ